MVVLVRADVTVRSLMAEHGSGTPPASDRTYDPLSSPLARIVNTTAFGDRDQGVHGKISQTVSRCGEAR